MNTANGIINNYSILSNSCHFYVICIQLHIILIDTPRLL